MNQDDLITILEETENNFYESGAYYDTDYENFLMKAYERIENTFKLSII